MDISDDEDLEAILAADLAALSDDSRDGSRSPTSVRLEFGYEGEGVGRTLAELMGHDAGIIDAVDNAAADATWEAFVRESTSIQRQVAAQADAVAASSAGKIKGTSGASGSSSHAASLPRYSPILSPFDASGSDHNSLHEDAFALGPPRSQPVLPHSRSPGVHEGANAAAGSNNSTSGAASHHFAAAARAAAAAAILAAHLQEEGLPVPSASPAAGAAESHQQAPGPLTSIRNNSKANTRTSPVASVLGDSAEAEMASSAGSGQPAASTGEADGGGSPVTDDHPLYLTEPTAQPPLAPPSSSSLSSPSPSVSLSTALPTDSSKEDRGHQRLKEGSTGMEDETVMEGGLSLADILAQVRREAEAQIQAQKAGSAHTKVEASSVPEALGEDRQHTHDAAQVSAAPPPGQLDSPAVAGTSGVSGSPARQQGATDVNAEALPTSTGSAVPPSVPQAKHAGGILLSATDLLYLQLQEEERQLAAAAEAAARVRQAAVEIARANALKQQQENAAVRIQAFVRGAVTRSRVRLFDQLTRLREQREAERKRREAERQAEEERKRIELQKMSDLAKARLEQERKGREAAEAQARAEAEERCSSSGF